MQISAYTTGEAARLCGLSLSTLKRWISRGSIGTYKTPGGNIRIPHEELLEFMKEYDIPFSIDFIGTKLLLYTKNVNRNLVNGIYEIYPDLQINIVDNEIELGFFMAQNRPQAIIFDEKTKDFNEKCKNIKRTIKPANIKIGVIDGNCSSQGKVYEVLNNINDEDGLKQFLCKLLEPSIKNNYRKKIA